MWASMPVRHSTTSIIPSPDPGPWQASDASEIRTRALPGAVKPAAIYSSIRIGSSASKVTSTTSMRRQTRISASALVAKTRSARRRRPSDGWQHCAGGWWLLLGIVGFFMPQAGSRSAMYIRPLTQREPTAAAGFREQYTGSYSSTRTGWTVGGGFEYMLSGAALCEV